MDKDKELELLMRSYDVPAVRSDLAQSIIDAAARVSQKQGVWRWICGVFEEFWLPAPAFCIALFLVIGFLAGAISYGAADSPAASDDIIRQLLNGEEGLL